METFIGTAIGTSTGTGKRQCTRLSELRNCWRLATWSSEAGQYRGVTRTTSFRTTAAAAVIAAVVLTGCGGDDDASDSETTSSSSTEAAEPRVPSADELEDLVVSLPAPFEQQPDDVIETGLMEPNHPESGTIAIGYAQEDDLVAAGFVRGWEKYFRAPDEAAMVGHVFVFESEDGPLGIMERFEATDEPGFERFEIPGVPGGVGFSGTSPEGRSAYAAASAHGRFLIGFTLGGPPGAHDYAALLESLMQDQYAALPDE